MSDIIGRGRYATYAIRATSAHNLTIPDGSAAVVLLPLA